MLYSAALALAPLTDWENSHNGAGASAALYSLVETAKANGLSPFDYLAHLFKELPKLAPGASLEHLLP